MQCKYRWKSLKTPGVLPRLEPSRLPSPPEERRAALRLDFQHVAAEAQVARDASHAGCSDELPPEGLLVCHAGKKLVGTITALPLAGRRVGLAPAQVVTASPRMAVENRLVTRRWLGCQCGQSCPIKALGLYDISFSGALERRGFDTSPRFFIS